MAFFYQFKDNNIYNFEFEGTFIDEIMDNKCILELSQKGAMVPDEGVNELNFPEHNVQHVGLQQDLSETQSIDSRIQSSRRNLQEKV